MTLEMPKLKYEERDLEPHLSRYQVKMHYGTHTKKYFDVVNDLARGTIYEGQDLEYLINKDTITKMESKLFLNACQAYNHAFYWNCMTPKADTKPSEELSDAIVDDLGSLAILKREFIDSAVSHFASGWTWLIWNKGRLQVKSTPNAGCPLTLPDQTPLLVCDLWEHAYLYDQQYAADRKSYVESFWKLIDWDFVSDNFAAAKRK